MILWGLGGRFLQPFCNSGYLLAEHPVDGGAADQVAFRQLAQAVTLLAVAVDGGTIEDQGFPSDVPAFELGPPHAGAHPFDDQAAFEFSDRPDDDHNRPAQGPAGIDLFAETDELGIQPVKFVQQLEEVSH